MIYNTYEDDNICYIYIDFIQYRFIYRSSLSTLSIFVFILWQNVLKLRKVFNRILFLPSYSFYYSYSTLSIWTIKPKRECQVKLCNYPFQRPWFDVRYIILLYHFSYTQTKKRNNNKMVDITMRKHTQKHLAFSFLWICVTHGWVVAYMVSIYKDILKLAE